MPRSTPFEDSGRATQTDPLPSVQLAGAGVPAGLIYGASDSQAAYPSRDPVTPEDIAATIYTILGIPHDAEITDTQGRPHRVQIGQPIDALVG